MSIKKSEIYTIYIDHGTFMTRTVKGPKTK